LLSFFKITNHNRLIPQLSKPIPLTNMFATDNNLLKMTINKY